MGEEEERQKDHQDDDFPDHTIDETGHGSRGLIVHDQIEDEQNAQNELRDGSSSYVFHVCIS